MLQSALAPQSGATRMRRVLVSITELARAEEASRQLPEADSLKSEATTSEVRKQLYSTADCAHVYHPPAAID
jgi:hypothetical protein